MHQGHPTQFQFELAQPHDDADLRAVLAATPTPGRISLCFAREPSYFAAAAVEGRFRQTIVVRDQRCGRIVGAGSRSVSLVFVNGRPAAVGYLSGLRGLPEVRRGTLLARGFRYLKHLHQDGRAAFYLTTIADGNREALRLLTSRRAGLPTYRDAGTYHTLLLPRRRRPAGRRPDTDVQLRQATAGDLPGLVAFWNRVGARRQFFPVLQATDVGQADGLYRDLQPAQILVAQRHADIVGTLGMWNQQSFRQTLVNSLPAWLSLARPLLNACSKLRGGATIPAAGQQVQYLTAALLVIADDDLDTLDLLLDAATRQPLSNSSPFLALGLHDSDPLLPAVQRRATLRYVTHVYLVHWDDGAAGARALDQRPMYLELGRL